MNQNLLLEVNWLLMVAIQRNKNAFLVSFNGHGEITQLATKRYMGEEDLESWIGKLSNYKEIDGFKIPTKIEGIWRLGDGDFSYAKFNVKKIDFNRPEQY